MAYNTRRSGEALNTVGARRNPPITNNFIPGGQLAPQNRPQQQPRPQGPPQPNGNFRPQQPQRMPGPPQQRPPQAQVPQKVPPVKVEQRNQPPQQQPAPIIPPDPSEGFEKEEQMQTDETGKKRPFWVTRVGKISRKERQRRRNVRLSKMLQPKNAVMILNELVKSATYTVTDLPQPAEMNQYTATVLVDGVSHVGHGRSKMEAKSMAAENALKYIVKNRQFSALKKEEEEGEEKMEVAEDGTPTLPWQHVASFALYKLLHSWGEDPNQRAMANQMQENSAAQPPQNKPAKKMPDNAAHINPLMLLNQMLPQAQFEELGRTGTPPNLIFTFRCAVDDQSFTGTGPNKKAAKKMAAFAVCHKVLGIQYPPEVYTFTN